MENVQLLSMLKFVDYKSQRLYTKEEDLNGLPKFTVLDYITELPHYVKLLKEKTALWMFVPVGENGEILKAPEKEEFSSVEADELFEHEKWLFGEASAKCMFVFENYTVEEDFIFVNDKQLMISRETGFVHFKNKQNQNVIYKTVNDLANEEEFELTISETGYYSFLNKTEE